MCSIVSEAPSAMTSLLLSKSRSRCGTAPSVAMACVARTELMWHSAQRGNAPHLRHHSTSQVHQLHVFPAHGDDALAAHGTSLVGSMQWHAHPIHLLDDAMRTH